MRATASRPALLDVIALIAGTAIGLAPLAAAREFLLDRPLPSDRIQQSRELLMRGQVGAASLLAGWSSAVVALDLLRPARGGRRSSRRGSGAVACYAAMAGVVGHLLVVLAQRLMHPGVGRWFDDPSDAVMILFPVSFNGGLLVGGAWLALLLTRRFRAGRPWGDRFGVVVGAGWIALLLVAHLRGLL